MDINVYAPAFFSNTKIAEESKFVSRLSPISVSVISLL